MELFRFANGVTSEDLMTANAQNTPMAFHGTMWRYKNAKQPNKKAAQTEPPKADTAQLSGKLDPKNPLVQEAQRLGYQIPADSLETPPDGQDQTPDQSDGLPDQDSGILTREALEGMDIEEIKSFAAAVGVVNINQKKEKLIKAILDKQA